MLDIGQLRRLFFMLFALVLSNPVQAYSKLVILGDSLSDTGNHPAALLGTPFPYYENRISNGPVAVDVLAADLGLSAANSGHLFGNGSGSNYAVSGANAAGNEPQDLNAQLDAFLGGRRSIDSNALYLVMIGGNDVRDATVIENTVQSTNKVIAAADAIELVLQQLIQAGAKSILVSNVPDISKIPETDERAGNNPGIHNNAQRLSIAFNQRLKQNIVRLNAGAGIEIFSFDFFSRFNQILAAPTQYGFSNTTEACFDNAPFGFHPQCDFDTFVFFDSIHPTAKTHQILGERMLELVMGSQQGPMSLPGVFMLLLE
jgi:phospholipase/lecithinase/hemolysin